MLCPFTIMTFSWLLLFWSKFYWLLKKIIIGHGKAQVPNSLWDPTYLSICQDGDKNAIQSYLFDLGSKKGRIDLGVIYSKVEVRSPQIPPNNKKKLWSNNQIKKKAMEWVFLKILNIYEIIQSWVKEETSNLCVL